MSRVPIKVADTLLVAALALAVGGLGLEIIRDLATRRAFAEPLRRAPPHGPPPPWWRKAAAAANAASAHDAADPHDDPEKRFASARDSFQ